MTFERNADQRGGMARGGRKGGRVGRFSGFLTSSSSFLAPPEQFSRVSPASGAVSEVRDGVIRLDRNNRAADRVQRLGRVSPTQTEDWMNRRCAATSSPPSRSPEVPTCFFFSSPFLFFFLTALPQTAPSKTCPITRNSLSTLERFARFLLGVTVVFV